MQAVSVEVLVRKEKQTGPTERWTGKTERGKIAKKKLEKVLKKQLTNKILYVIICRLSTQRTASDVFRIR